VLSSRVVDGYQMYSGGAVVVDKASTIDIQISPTHLLTFIKVKKCEICRRFQHHSIWAARVWKCSKVSERWNKFVV